MKCNKCHRAPTMTWQVVMYASPQEEPDKSNLTGMSLCAIDLCQECFVTFIEAFPICVNSPYTYWLGKPLCKGCLSWTFRNLLGITIDILT